MEWGTRNGWRSKRILVLLLCVVPVTFWSYEIRRDFQSAIKMADFSTVYFAARCAIHHKDPYNRSAYLQELLMDRVSFATNLEIAPRDLDIFMRCVYLPTALLGWVPFALLPWATAQNVFLVLMAVSLTVAAFLIWDLGGEFAPVLSGWLVGFLLASCMLLMLVGNPAGVVVGFCVIAAWCFLRKRYEPAGVALLAVSLMVKPHDAGFVWLYFLLAGGTGRKRSLETLAVTAVLGACAAVWIAPASPHWLQELHNNVGADSIRGGINDPGASGMTEHTFGPVISLQNAISIFRDDPRFYNPVSFFIGGGLILCWAFEVLRKRSSWEGALLGLAAISALTMLPLYHRPHDAKLLLLTIPACAMLWAAKGARRWVALGLTAAAIFVTSDIPIIAMVSATAKLPVSTATLAGKLMLLALHPAPLVLLAAGCFYLWAYIRYDPEKGLGREKTAEKWLDAALAE